jgi:hypothetical protein
MNQCIYSPIFPIASSPHSHRRGWAELWSHHLDVPIFQKGQKLSDFDKVYVYHGHEIGSEPTSLNYFLKSDESYQELADRLHRFASFQGEYVSLDWGCPNYAWLVEQRTTSHMHLFDHIDFEQAGQRCNDMPWQSMLFRAAHQIIGDSHAGSVWQPGASISRNDFKTLHGALQQGLDTFVEGHPSRITWYFGNIDIRHHLGRTDNPMNAARELATRYTREALSLAHETEFIAPLPIEPETRKIPKSGHYKKTAYYGTWDERNEIRRVFIDTILDVISDHPRASLFNWPATWTTDTGMLNEVHMERPRSVHLSPSFYRWKTDQQVSST